MSSAAELLDERLTAESQLDTSHQLTQATDLYSSVPSLQHRLDLLPALAVAQRWQALRFHAKALVQSEQDGITRKKLCFYAAYASYGMEEWSEARNWARRGAQGAAETLGKPSDSADTNVEAVHWDRELHLVKDAAEEKLQREGLQGLGLVAGAVAITAIASVALARRLRQGPE